MDRDDSDTLSETGSTASSNLSFLSRSPSPPTSPMPGVDYLPTPSSSQHSSHKGSPMPDNMPPSAGASAMARDLHGTDAPPPAKKRKIYERKPRTTEYLDLTSGEVAADSKPQLDRLLNVLHRRRKIVVIAGAGISVSAGIPDFRSSTGLFNSLKSQHNLKSSGKDLFDASVYRDGVSTSTFHDMVRQLSKETKSAKPTAFHHLLATLAQEGRLLRLYSQNVDGLDTSLPPLATQIPLPSKPKTTKTDPSDKPEKFDWPKTIQLHGGLDKMVCTKCSALSDLDAELFQGPVPPLCKACEAMDNARTAYAGKRSHGIGCLRPRMVLYNEHNPDDEAIGSVTTADLRTRPDAVIVAGTTLKVPGVRRIVREMCGVVRDRKDGVTVWINNDPEPVGKDLENCWDVVVRGPCDEVARQAAMRKWDQEETIDWMDPMRTHPSPEVQVPQRQQTELDATMAIPSPQKQHAGLVDLPTPAASPRIKPKSKPLALVKSKGRGGAKVSALAKSGLEVTKVPTKQTKPTKPRARKATSTTTKPRKTPAKKDPAANGKLTFKVSKPVANTTGKPMSQPRGTAKKFDSNFTSALGTPMSPIPSSDPRVNKSAPATEAHPKTPSDWSPNSQSFYTPASTLATENMTHPSNTNVSAGGSPGGGSGAGSPAQRPPTGMATLLS
ncbi:DHS-like NAD/FAD-binding domain-containing protein [Aulographum hederae CBS 113979]|uniref:DHS-like NAD/FAD-binding domain-containing protein n=1 Tax=Aulographum hederae CBS 113979 TaxID=1176131 RepID=A0A6G1GVP2_9PEZI|nr:DHS-like NAD/FAD-binding domain-containing protein [Aulographum hederae CBS 113979]